MQVISRQTSYPVDRRAYTNVLGFFLLGVVGMVAIVASRLDRGDWSFLSPWDGALVAAYLFVAALIVHKLRHPDRAPIGKVEVTEAGEKTQARVAAIFERHRR